MRILDGNRLTPGGERRTSFRSCLVFAVIGATAAFIVGILLVNFILLPWHVNLGREANVPNILGLDRDEAEKALRATGFSLGDARYVADTLYPAGKVVDTRPKPGTRVKVGRVVGIDISAGQEKTLVPQAALLPVRRAQAAIENAGLRVGAIETVSSTSVPEGQVIYTDPPSGSRVNKGTAVNVTVSMGSQGVFEMPRLKGMTLAKARDIIVNTGLVLTDTTAKVSAEPSGTVLSQDPAEHAEVQAGDAVHLTVARAAAVKPAQGTNSPKPDKSKAVKTGTKAKTTAPKPKTGTKTK